MKGTGVDHQFGSAPTGIMEPPAVVLPDRQLFSQRAARLRELSESVPALGDFLGFMGRVVQAQQQVLDSREPSWAPAADAFDAALAHGMPPLGAQALRRDIDWQSDLRALLDALDLQVAGNQRPLLDALRAMPEAALDDLSERVLIGDGRDEATRALMPLVAAALQVAWVRLASRLPRAPQRPKGEARLLCPCCGAPALGSVIQSEPQRHGVRYLHCSLCATEWHLERVTCSVCLKGGQLQYFGLDGEDGKLALPAQAEACKHCLHYVKIVPREFNANADILADDLASLALDLMLDEQGDYQRSSYNPFLIAGG